jgi:hypothetical protein
MSSLQTLNEQSGDQLYRYYRLSIFHSLLPVALVLLAIRNEGLVLPGNREFEDNVLIESLVLPIIKAVNLYLPVT